MLKGLQKIQEEKLSQRVQRTITMLREMLPHQKIIHHEEEEEEEEEEEKEGQCVDGPKVEYLCKYWRINMDMRIHTVFINYGRSLSPVLSYYAI